MSDRNDHDLRTSIEDFIDGSLSAADAQGFSTRLTTDKRARQVYLEMMQMQADLEWLHGVCNDGAEVPTSNGKAIGQKARRTSDWLTPALIANCRESLTNGELLQPSSSTRELQLVNHATDSTPGVRRSRFGRVVANAVRYSAVTTAVLLLSVAAVVAGERIYVLVREVLMPPRTMIANDGGGLLRSSEDERLVSGANSIGTRRIGSSSLPGVALANVFVFPLPPLEKLERIHSARLGWTYKHRDGEPEFSVDLYGLGFVKPGDFVGQGFWEGENDTSPRSAYGMAGSGGRSVAKIATGVMTPSTPRGRLVVKNGELVRFLHSLYDDGAQEGDLAVFRLNADESTVHARRTTGYAVVHPPAREGRTSPSDLPLLSITAERGVPVDSYSVAGLPVSAQAITAHWASGSAGADRKAISNGCDFRGVRRVGSSSWEGGALTNVFVFTLPDITESEQIDFASLEWTLLSLQGQPRFSIDLYGLGYMAGDNFNENCYWEGELDKALSAEYGLSGSADGRVVLLARKVMSPNTQAGRIVMDSQSLAAYLQSLYDYGARGGDLVVFRLNADTSTRHEPRSTGYSVVHPPSISGRTTDVDLPVLRVTAK